MWPNLPSAVGLPRALIMLWLMVDWALALCRQRGHLTGVLNPGRLAPTAVWSTWLKVAVERTRRIVPTTVWSSRAGDRCAVHLGT